MPILNLKVENDCQQALKDYLERNASDVLAEKINNGVEIEKDGKKLINKKTLTQFWNYATNKAQEMKTGYVANDTVFGWAIHYFEESSMEGTLYNEDGTEYKPTPKPVQRVHTPIIPAKPTPKQPQQFNLFDMMAQAKTEESTPEEKAEPVEEIDNNDDIAVDEPTELNVDMETGEIIPKKEEKKSIPLQQASPLYQKYMRIQNQYPQAVIAYRLGDFYEIFGDNAIRVSNHLELTLTGRDCGLAKRVPMVGFPYHASDTYFRKIAEFLQVIVADGETIAPFITEEKTAIQTPVIEEKPTIDDEDDDFEEERALQQFFDKEALSILYEIFEYDLEIQ